MKKISLISEATTLAKFYLKSGQLSQEDFEKLKQIDPTGPDKFKFVDWMAKQWINKNVTNWDDLRNKIEEYAVLLDNGKAITKNIDNFSTFEDLRTEVDDISNSGANLSNKDLESDFEIVADNEHMYVIAPDEHLASRSQALKHFSHRVCGDGKIDCAWCTTFKDDSQFVDKYFVRDQTIYYCAIKSDELLEKLKEIVPDRDDCSLRALAILVNRDGTYTGTWDSADSFIDVDITKQIVNLLNKYRKK